VELTYDSKVGRGAFGEVWSEIDNLGRRVAVKFFNDTTPNLAETRAFEHAKALARVHHPAVVRLLSVEQQPHPDLGTEALSIIMEFVDGTSLSKYVPAFTTEHAREMLLDVAGALEAIHAVGLVHGRQPRELRSDSFDCERALR
jgi:serine/threonine protein kinase